MTGSSATLDTINRRTYGRRHIVRHYTVASGWLEAGEQAAIGHVADRVRGQSILDIGVGGGRTAPLMLAVSRDYVGIDYMPPMVAASRARFPDLDFREMDARALSFVDGRFALAAFSYNGIDSVSPEDRRLVLREVRRVLRDEGYFVFSSLNRDGPLCRPPSYPRHAVDQLTGSGRHVSRLRAAAILAVGRWNRWRYRRVSVVAPERALVNIGAHAYGLVATFISPAAQELELAEAGFTLDAIYCSADGKQLAAGKVCTLSDCLYYVARKTGSGQKTTSGNGQPSAG